MNSDFNNIIIENIRRKIDEKGIKHCKIAENLGMSKGVFSGMLNGRKVIQASYIPVIARTLECTCDDLFQTPKESAT